MWKVSPLTREQFISWIGKSFEPIGEPANLSVLKRIVNREEVCLIWRAEERYGAQTEAPVIVVEDRAIREFFSFTNTYIGTHFPFTAFFRVVRRSLLEELLTAPSSGGPLPPEKLVGALIAEARLQLGLPRKPLSEINIQSCLATMSFSAAIGLGLNTSDDGFATIFNNWARSRGFLSDEGLAVSIERIEGFWRIVRSALVGRNNVSSSKHGLLVHFVWEVLHSADDHGSELWALLTEGLPKSRQALRRMRDAREERVRAMDDIVREILKADLEVEIAEVLLGYAASRVANGSLRYFNMLEELEERFPLSTMWFGLFCSSNRETDALTIAECLGRRVLRHLEQSNSIFLPPSHDISFDELAVVMSLAKAPRWRTEFQSVVSIEIFPGLSPAFRLGRSSSNDSPRESFSADIFREMRYLTNRLSRVIESIDSPKQGRLFDEEKRNKYPRPRRTDR